MADQGGPPKHDTQGAQLAIGLAIVLLGLWFLGRTSGLPFFDPFFRAWSEIRRFGWAVVIIALGAAIVVLSQRGGLRLPKDKRLYRSRSKKMVSGVLGGLSDYFGVDATILRLVFVALILLLDAGPAIIAYIIASFVIPLEPETGPGAVSPAPPPASPPPPPPPPAEQ